MNFKKYAFALSLLCLVALVGCGGGKKVAGKVTFADGSPLTAGVVCFVNQDTKANFRAKINKDGTFETNAKQGVKKGVYSVIITGAFLEDEDGGEEALIDPKYSDPNKSGLKLTVGGNVADYAIQVSEPSGEMEAPIDDEGFDD